MAWFNLPISLRFNFKASCYIIYWLCTFGPVIDKFSFLIVLYPRSWGALFQMQGEVCGISASFLEVIHQLRYAFIAFVLNQNMVIYRGATALETDFKFFDANDTLYFWSKMGWLFQIQIRPCKKPDLNLNIFKNLIRIHLSRVCPCCLYSFVNGKKLIGSWCCLIGFFNDHHLNFHCQGSKGRQEGKSLHLDVISFLRVEMGGGMSGPPGLSDNNF